MTPDELTKILLRDEYQVLDILPENFIELEQYIRARAYTYRPAICQLTIKLPTQIHASVSDWAAMLKIEGEAIGAFDSRDLLLVPEGRLTGFINQYQGITKVPDCAIVPRGRFWPTIVFEFGYTEPYDDLKADVKLLLEGSRGKITKAILIKLDPLYDGETQIQKGFLETWHLSDGNAKKDGGRKTLFPTPRSHASQQLNLPLRELFRNRFDDLTNQGWGKEGIVPLHLDDLRTSIEEGTWRHLVQNGILYDNDDSA